MISLTVVAGSVRAENTVPPANSPPAEPEASVWYGWQVMIADGLAIAALVAGSDGRSGLLLTSLAIYELGGPAVHAGNLQGWNALGSLGLRLAGTALGLAVFSETDCQDGPADEVDCSGAFIGGLTMLGLAAVVDAGLLAHRPPHPPPRPDTGPPAAPERPPPDYMLVPTFQFRHGAAQIGALLTF